MLVDLGCHVLDIHGFPEITPQIIQKVILEFFPKKILGPSKKPRRAF
jgi:hypothetical protein